MTEVEPIVVEQVRCGAPIGDESFCESETFVHVRTMGFVVNSEGRMSPEGAADAVELYGLWCIECGKYLIPPDVEEDE